MSVGDVESPAPHKSTVTVGWFVRRLVLAVAILFVSVGSLAWLTHAAIDEDGARQSETLFEMIGRVAAQF